VYNGAETLRRTIKSVANQTYNHIEYIVVDGGSTDGTVDIIKENGETIDYWISEPDEGIYHAMNKGIACAKGEIIGILNSDDWYEPEAVEAAVDAFCASPRSELVHGAMRVWSSSGQGSRLYGSKKEWSPVLVSPFNHPTCFVLKDVYVDIGRFDIAFETAADYDFMLRFLNSGKRELYLDTVLANFREGGVSTDTPFSPYSQIWNVLRKNRYPPLSRVKAIGFRIVRDIMAVLLNGKVPEALHRYRSYIS
jgi:glycosyltransferase involved in cell wall biosynthesis